MQAAREAKEAIDEHVAAQVERARAEDGRDARAARRGIEREGNPPARRECRRS